LRLLRQCLLVGFIVWILSAVLFRLIGPESGALKLAVSWSFAFTVCCAVVVAFHYAFYVDLPKLYANSDAQMSVSRNDLVLVVCYIIGMFVGLPLSGSLFKTSEVFSTIFSVGCAFLFFLIVLGIVRLFFHASKTGRLFMRGGFVERSNAPNVYRFYYGFLVFIATVFMGLGSLLLALVVYH
jgi:hypothetical protein